MTPRKADATVLGLRTLPASVGRHAVPSAPVRRNQADSCMCRPGSSICESALRATSSEGATTIVLREQSGLLVLGYRAGLSVPRSKL